MTIKTMEDVEAHNAEVAKFRKGEGGPDEKKMITEGAEALKYARGLAATIPLLDKGAVIGPKTPPKGMNGVETRYAEQVLNPMLWAKEITQWEFEGISVKLADGARYKPDFNLFYPDGLVELIEIKAHKLHEASILRLKVAIEKYPWFRFRLVQWSNKQWIEKKIR